MDRLLKPRVLAVGNVAHADFAAARALLRTASQVYFVPHAGYAAAWLPAHPPVDWILLFQSRPGELPRDLVEQLRLLSSNARFVSVLGSWCEGELRTGRPWSDVPRVYWHAFPTWWRQNVAQTLEHSSTCRGTIAVSAADLATAETLLDALASEGWSGTWWPRQKSSPRTTNYVAGIWVGGQLSGPEAVQLDEFCRKLRDERVPVVGLLDFPRIDRVAIAQRIGVKEVLGKPWRIDILSRTLEHLIDAHRHSTDFHRVARSA